MPECFNVMDIPDEHAEYREAYWWYLHDNCTNSEKTLSPSEYVAFRKQLEAEGRKY
jgi:hypothetical protein